MLEHMQKMRNNDIVANIGHLNNEIQKAELEEFPGIKVETSSHKWIVLFSHMVIGFFLASGPLLNLGVATGHPSLVMYCFFTNQVLGQLALLKN